MTLGWPVAMLLSLALGASCAHTRTTDSGETKEGDRQASGKAKAGEPGAGTNPNLHPGHPEEVPVATRPEALLVPGADDDALARLHRHRTAERQLAEPGGDPARVEHPPDVGQ